MQSKNAKIFCVVAAFSPKNKKLTLKYSQGIAIILAGAHCQHFCSETMPPIPVAHHINQINSSHAKNGTADIIHQLASITTIFTRNSIKNMGKIASPTTKTQKTGPQTDLKRVDE